MGRFLSLIFSKMHQCSNRKISKVNKQLEEELLNDNFFKRKEAYSALQA